jgi:hypothetical protein
VTDARRYRHYGLTVESNVPLPGLPATEAGPTDVKVDFVLAHERPKVDSTWTTVGQLGSAWQAWRAPGAAGSRLRLQVVGPSGSWGEFRIEDGGEIVRVTLDEWAVLDDACEALITSIFSCVLAQRGLTCLHASVVAVEDRVIALVGASGDGKSTLALALVQRGGRLLADDVAAISLRAGDCWVAAGRPALRIPPDSAASLGATFTELRSVWTIASPDGGKRYYEVDANRRVPDPSWLPLAGVFLLGPRCRGGPARARPVVPADLLPALLANRHMAQVLDQAGHRRDFACLAALVRRVPARELIRPDDLATVSAVADAVAVDVGGLTNPAWRSCSDIV